MGLYLSKLLSPFYSCEPPSLTHIDDLSNEVLVKIFQFLCEPRCWDKAASEVDWYGLPCTNISWNRRQLHKICKVCARWNGIVLEHFKKTDVLDFSLVNGNDMWKNRLQCLDAKYFTTGIYVSASIEFYNEFLDVERLNKIGEVLGNFQNICELYIQCEQLTLDLTALEHFFNRLVRPASMKAVQLEIKNLEDGQHTIICNFLDKHPSLQHVKVAYPDGTDFTRIFKKLVPKLIRPNVPDGCVVGKNIFVTDGRYEPENVLQCLIERISETFPKEQTWEEAWEEESIKPYFPRKIRLERLSAGVCKKVDIRKISKTLFI